MALIACKECNRDISAKASRCPHCGTPYKTTFRLGITLVGILIAVVIGVIIVSSILFNRSGPRATVTPSQQDIRAQGHSLRPSNDAVTKELNIGRYTVRLQTEGTGKQIYFMEILGSGKRVYSRHIKQGESGWLILNLGDDKYELHLPPPGKDINGDGIPDLVVEEFSGGAHCCSSYLIFSLGKEFKKLTVGEGENLEGFEFRDIDGDNVYELVGNRPDL